MSKSLFARTRYVRTARLRRQRREELCNPIIDYLMKQENEAETLDEQDHYKFCRRVVSLALEAWPEPFVAAFYYHYGRHPDKLIPEWLQRDEFAKTLGPSLADLLKDPLFLVPDYDPTIPIRRPTAGLAPVYQMPAPGWPAEQDTLRDSQEKELASQPRISHTDAADFARPNAFLEARRQSHKEWRQRRIGVLMMCTQCPNPICEESRCLCAFHLQRAREASAASYMRKRLAMGKTVKHCKGWQERQLAELVGLA